jgi:hypothetical protein
MQIYVEHSGRQDHGVLGQPFGYLTAIKRDEHTTEACLVLLPYNYTELAALLRSRNFSYLFFILFYFLYHYRITSSFKI